MQPDETANEMCEGATPTDCWSFAHSRDTMTDGRLDLAKLTPCIVPMVETPDCPEGQLCIEIAPDYVEQFKEINYVVPMGASIVCQAKGQTFMRGIVKEPITARMLEMQRSAAMIQVEITDTSTVDEVSSMAVKSNLVPMATISHELYGRTIDGFETLGSDDPFTTLRNVFKLIGSQPIRFTGL